MQNYTTVWKLLIIFQSNFYNRQTMDRVYYVSRIDIIDWINRTLDINLTKIEQLGTGAIYCHLLDAAFPEKVPMNKIKWNAKTEVDYLYNFKLLQVCFDHLNIQKRIEIEKLVKMKCQDNLEFIQWMKAFLQPIIQINSNYDAKKRRKGIQISYQSRIKKNISNNAKINKSLNLSTSFSKKQSSNIDQKVYSPVLYHKKPLTRIYSQKSLQKHHNFSRSLSQLYPCQGKQNINQHQTQNFVQHKWRPLNPLQKIIHEKYALTNSLMIISDEQDLEIQA